MIGLRLFALGESRAFGGEVAAAMKVSLAAHEEREFEDGEHKSRPLDPVRGADVYVIHALHSDPFSGADTKLVRLLFFLATLRDHGAARVTAVLPYLCYARKDRRTKHQDPLASRNVAMLFEAMGVDVVLALDVHNPAAFENAFRCRAYELNAVGLFADRLLSGLGDVPVTVLSPDGGGIKRADAMRQALARRLGREVQLGLMEKQRSGGVVSGETLFADVEGRAVVIVDDLIATGGTLLRCARAARAKGAVSVVAAATHVLMVGGAAAALGDPAFDSIIVSDSVPAFRLADAPTAARMQVVGVAPLFADAIRCLHEDRTLEGAQ